MSASKPPNFEVLAVNAGSAFSPTSPIDVRGLFAGRHDQVRMIVDVINQKGQHAMLFGERGVGKTSLANMLPSYIVCEKPILAPRINCDSTDNFDRVWRKALGQVELSETIKSMGFDKSSKRKTVALTDTLGEEPISPDRVRIELTILGQDALVIFIIDEFDTLAPEMRRPFADLIKSLSDHAVPATIVLVGVAENVEQLIDEHQSVERALIHVQMPRMSSEEVAEILVKGAAKLTMTFSEKAKGRIVRVAQGLPHYAHLLGLHACRVALDSKRLEVTPEDVTEAMRKAINGAQASVRSAYELAVRSSQKGNLFEAVLLACAITPTDEFGFFAAKDVRDPLRRITGKMYDVPSFGQHLNEFSDGKRGNVLSKEGSARLFRYRFSNPLIQPFVVMRGIDSGRITPDALD